MNVTTLLRMALDGAQAQQNAVPDSVAATSAAEKTQNDQPHSAAGPAAPEPRMRSCRNSPQAAQPVSAARRASQHRRMASGYVRCDAPWMSEMEAEAQPAPRRPEARRLHCPHSAAST